MDITSSLDFMFDEAQKFGVEQFDIFASTSNYRGLDIFEKEVKEREISFSQGIGIRIIYNNKLGYSFTQKLDQNSMRQVIKDAMDHSNLSQDIGFDLPEFRKNIANKFYDLQLWNDDLENISMNTMKKIGLELEELSLSSSSYIKNIPYLSLGYGAGSQYLKNSKGLYVSSKDNSFYVDLGITAEKQNSLKMGYFGDSFMDIKQFNSQEFSDIAVKYSLELLGAKPIPSGKYPVVLSNRVSSSLIRKYTGNFCADQVQKGFSRLKNKRDKKIAISNFNMYSDPLIVQGSSSYLWDDEGIPAQKVSLVKNGILQNFLYDLETAHKDKCESNGHASRDYADAVSPSSANLIVEQGNQTVEELLSVYPQCLYVTELEGSSGCSAISGDISIGVQGFWVEKGEIKHPVEEVTMSGNFYDFLLHINGLSNSYTKKRSSIKAPDILTDCFFIAGS